MATQIVAAGGGNWSSSATWTPGSVPAAGDSVIVHAASGQLTIDVTTNAIASIDFTTYTGTLTINAGVALTLGGGVAGNFTLVSGMTVTLVNAATSAIAFTHTTTGCLVTTGGKTLGNVTFNGAAGGWTLQDAMTVGTTASVTLTAGTLITNGQTCSWGQFVSANSNTRTLTLGASAVTISSNSQAVWQTSTTTGLTVSSNTATLTFTGTNIELRMGNANWQGASIVISGASSGANGCLMTTLGTFANFTRSGTAVKTDDIRFSPTGCSLVVTGTLNLSGNSTTNRLNVLTYNGPNATPGTQQTITAAAVSVINVDFMDIAGAGVAAPFTGSSIGDCQGNSNITFTTPVTRYAVVAGNWSSTATWSTSSGGSGGASVPLPQDTVNFDTNSAAGTYTADMLRISKDLACTGFTGTMSWPDNTTNTVFGNLTLGSGMTLQITGQHRLALAGRGTQTITSAGKKIGLVAQNDLLAPGGTYTQQDAINFDRARFSVSNGTWNTNGFSVNVDNIISNGTATRSVILNTSVITLGGVSTSAWQMTASGLTFSGANSTIVIASTFAGSHNFSGGGFTYGTIQYNVANSPGTLNIQNNNNTIGTLTVGSGRSVTFPSSTVVTFINAPTWTGIANGYVYFPGASGAYASAPDSAALSVTGNITLDVKVAMTSWAPAANSMLVAKNPGASTVDSYDLYVETTGKLVLRASQAGSSLLTWTSSVATGLGAGTTKWVRASLTLSTSKAQFFTSTDGSTWSQLGTDITGSAISGINDSTGTLEIGSNTAGISNLTTGQFFEVRVFNSALGSGSGTPVFDADFTLDRLGTHTYLDAAQTQFAESSSNAATVTLNGLAQVGDGRIALNSSTPATQGTIAYSNGTIIDDYLVIQDSNAVGGAAWYAGTHSGNVSNNTGWAFSLPVSTNPGGPMMMGVG